ncbi:hypothetical protein ACQ4PT_020620 [Festuca glaucescens]
MGKAEAVDQHLADLSAPVGRVLEKLDVQGEAQQRQGAQLEKLEALQPVIEDLLEWRPYLEQSVRELRQDLVDLRAHVAELPQPIVLDSSKTDFRQISTADAPPTPRASAFGAPRAGDDGRGPHGHRVDSTVRGMVVGEPSFSRPAPGKALH